MRKRCNFVIAFNHLTHRFAFRLFIRNLTARVVLLACVSLAARSEAQIQVEMKFKRLQYIAYEPVVATLSITNLAGRDIDLHDADGQSWLGFEITGSDGQSIAP